MKYTVQQLQKILYNFPPDLVIDTELSLEWEYDNDLKEKIGESELSSKEFYVETMNNATQLNIYNGSWKKGTVNYPLELPILLEDTHNADGRTSDSDFTVEDLRVATEHHIDEVAQCMDFFSKKIHETGLRHDWTKMYKFETEYAPLVMEKLDTGDFKHSDWYQNHIHSERHHINADAKTDVNLIDVLEHIADTVTAGKGRSGYLSSKHIDVKPDLLYRCYWNTVRLLDENTKRK